MRTLQNTFEHSLRHSGIEIVGDVAWGTHFCQFYETTRDLTDVLVPYFKAGIAQHEKCVWVTSEFLNTGQAVKALRKEIPDLPKRMKRGQIEVFPHTEWYLKGGVFEMKRVLSDWVKKHDEAIAGGYTGLRVSGNPFWIDNKKDWDDFSKYEAEINDVINGYKMIVLCTYSLAKCSSSEVFDVVTNHEFALVKRNGRWENIESAGHKKMEHALRESEQRMRSYTEITGQLGWTTNAKGEVEDDIPFWRRYTGQSYIQVKGWGWIQALHPDDVARVKNEWLRSIEKKIPYETEYRIRGKDNIYRDFLVRGLPLMDKKGNISEWVGTCIDISRLKGLDRQKDEFISVASHELKTPLTSIKIYGQIIERSLARGSYIKLPELTKRLNKQIAIQEDYINELLDVTRIQTGKLHLHTRKFDIYPFLRDEIIHLRTVYPEHKLTCRSIHQSIVADKERLRQVLVNLVTNAVKNSPVNSEIKISATRRNHGIVVSIRDFGTGIPSEQHSRVFERFYQISGNSIGKNSGLGLGLFISKDIVERHKGKIWLKSAAGKGSTFAFMLPLLRS